MVLQSNGVMFNVLCLKHGAKYDAEYVNKLYRAVERNCTYDFMFHCMTDNPTGLDPNIHPIILPDLGPEFAGERRAWWYKPFMFSDKLGFEGPTLYLDLDVVIIANIDRFFDFELGQFCICQDFNRYKIPDYRVLNTSVVRFDAGKVTHMYDKFIEWNEEGTCIGRLHGDQDFVTRFFERYPEYQRVLWPYNWAMSWKWEIKGEDVIKIKDGIKTYVPPPPPVYPEDLAIMVFHGKPNPGDELTVKMIANNWY